MTKNFAYLLFTSVFLLPISASQSLLIPGMDACYNQALLESEIEAGEDSTKDLYDALRPSRLPVAQQVANLTVRTAEWCGGYADGTYLFTCFDRDMSQDSRHGHANALDAVALWLFREPGEPITRATSPSSRIDVQKMGKIVRIVLDLFAGHIKEEDLSLVLGRVLEKSIKKPISFEVLQSYELYRRLDYAYDHLKNMAQELDPDEVSEYEDEQDRLLRLFRSERYTPESFLKITKKADMWSKEKSTFFPYDPSVKILNFIRLRDRKTTFEKLLQHMKSPWSHGDYDHDAIDKTQARYEEITSEYSSYGRFLTTINTTQTHRQYGAHLLLHNICVAAHEAKARGREAQIALLQVLAAFAVHRATEPKDLEKFYDELGLRMTFSGKSAFSMDDYNNLTSRITQSPEAYRDLSEEERQNLSTFSVLVSASMLPLKTYDRVTVRSPLLQERTFSNCYEVAFENFLRIMCMSFVPGRGWISDTRLFPDHSLVQKYFAEEAFGTVRAANTEDASNTFATMISGIPNVRYVKKGSEVIPSVLNTLYLLSTIWCLDEPEESDDEESDATELITGAFKYIENGINRHFLPYGKSISLRAETDLFEGRGDSDSVHVTVMEEETPVQEGVMHIYEKHAETKVTTPFKDSDDWRTLLIAHTKKIWEASDDCPLEFVSTLSAEQIDTMGESVPLNVLRTFVDKSNMHVLDVMVAQVSTLVRGLQDEHTHEYAKRMLRKIATTVERQSDGHTSMVFTEKLRAGIKENVIPLDLLSFLVDACPDVAKVFANGWEDFFQSPFYKACINRDEELLLIMNKGFEKEKGTLFLSHYIYGSDGNSLSDDVLWGIEKLSHIYGLYLTNSFAILPSKLDHVMHSLQKLKNLGMATLAVSSEIFDDRDLLAYFATRLPNAEKTSYQIECAGENRSAKINSWEICARMQKENPFLRLHVSGNREQIMLVARALASYGCIDGNDYTLHKRSGVSLSFVAYTKDLRTTIASEQEAAGGEEAYREKLRSGFYEDQYPGVYALYTDSYAARGFPVVDESLFATRERAASLSAAAEVDDV
ncbi:MAG: hypothetical protein H6849_04035 [Alphaproteobacteria bacterium]|nr:MAG: hypothetical protein H6849_04035 [Alphaproteobacteria bacterium]